MTMIDHTMKKKTWDYTMIAHTMKKMTWDCIRVDILNLLRCNKIKLGRKRHKDIADLNISILIIFAVEW